MTDHLQRVRACTGKGARLTIDSRRVRAGDVFAALKGLKHDGLDFAANAVRNGAACIVCEPRAELPDLPVDIVCVENLAQELGPLASEFYGEPTAHMRGVAVTGTNGKTSTSHWIAAALNALHHPCAVIGTMGAFLGGQTFEAPALTTPDAASNQTLFADIYAAGAQCFAIEASSIGLEQERLAGSRFETAVFTNLTRDHLDYHGTLQNYEAAKARLFAWPGLKNAVLNVDDPVGVRFAELAVSRGVRTVACSQTGKTPAGAEPLVAERVQSMPAGMRFTVRWQGEAYEVASHVLGRFNVDNLLAVAGTLLTLGLPPKAVFDRLSELRAPAGRLQAVAGERGPMVVVDYAHTPDALEKAIASLRDVAEVRGGAITAVFGAGGDRDSGKRPLMGEAAARGADSVIVTSDNPRTEDPEAIARAVAAGVAAAGVSPRIVLDRREAIFKAVREAKDNDIVLVAGKGHEDYQDIAGVKHHFSDYETALEALDALKGTV